MQSKHKLVSAPVARRDYLGNITHVTEHRWRKAGILPKPIKIRNRCFYREADLLAIQDRFDGAHDAAPTGHGGDAA